MYILPKIVKKICGHPAMKKVSIDNTSKVDVFSVVVGTSFGKYSYAGEHTSILYSTVGSFTSISNYCAIGGGGHTLNWVSSSPVFNNNSSILHRNLANLDFDPFQNTKIGNDVWIGSHCLIKAGVTVSDGAVIGMGSVVTKNIGPYEIWAGNPAKFIKKRFDDNTIEKLLEIQWWNWDDQRIIDNANYFNNIENFLEMNR